MFDSSRGQIRAPKGIHTARTASCLRANRQSQRCD